MKKSEYIHIISAVADKLSLMDDCILVEEVPKPEVTYGKSSLVVATDPRQVRDGFDQNRPIEVIVLATGQGYAGDKSCECSDEVLQTGCKCGAITPCRARPGNVCLVSLNVKWLSYFGPIVATEGKRIGIACDADVQYIYETVDEYNEAFQTMHKLLYPNEQQ